MGKKLNKIPWFFPKYKIPCISLNHNEIWRTYRKPWLQRPWTSSLCFWCVPAQTAAREAQCRPRNRSPLTSNTRLLLYMGSTHRHHQILPVRYKKTQLLCKIYNFTVFITNDHHILPVLSYVKKYADWIFGMTHNCFVYGRIGRTRLFQYTPGLLGYNNL